MYKAITTAIALSIVSTSAFACGGWEKFTHGGMCKEEWVEARTEQARERLDRNDSTFEINGNYAYTLVGEEVIMTPKADIIRAFQYGGTSAVADLIGDQAADQMIEAHIEDGIAQGAISESQADYIREELSNGSSIDEIKADLNIQDEFIATAVDAAGNEINSLTIVNEGIETTIDGADFESDSEFQAAIDEAASAIEASVGTALTQEAIDAFQADLQAQVESGELSPSEFNQKTEEFFNAAGQPSN